LNIGNLVLRVNHCWRAKEGSERGAFDQAQGPWDTNAQACGLLQRSWFSTDYSGIASFGL
jgi:hypothetical protein